MSEIVKRIRGDKKIRRVILCFMGILAAVSLIQGCRNAILVSQDFQWDAAKALVLGINPYDESLEPSGILDGLDFEKYYLQMEANQFPSLLLLLFPYTLLPPLAARYAWLLSNLFFTAGCIFLLRKTFLKAADDLTFSFFMLLMIAGTPYRNQIGVGQHTVFSFFFFLLAVYFADRQDKTYREDYLLREKPGFSIPVTLCLFVCYFKYTLTLVLILYLIYRKRYREIAVSALIHVGLTVFSAFLLKDSFINMIIKPLKVSMKLAGEGGLDIGALLGGSKISLVMAVLIFFLLFAFSLLLSRSGKAEGIGMINGSVGEVGVGRGKTSATWMKNSSTGKAGAMSSDPKVAISEGPMKGEEKDACLISVLILWSLIITYHRTYDFFVIVTVLALVILPKCPGYLKYLYGAVLILVFFVLRIFSESLPSKIVTGAVYYLFTILVTLWGVRGNVRIRGIGKGR